MAVQFTDEQKRLVNAYYPGLGVVPPNVGDGGLLGIIATAVDDAIAEATAGSVGDIADLTTEEDGSAVDAINEVDAHADALAGRESGLISPSALTKLLVDVGDLRTKLAAAVTDITNLRSKLNTLHTAYMATLAKLDADAANTALDDTNYAATNPSTAPDAVTATAPAAATASAPTTSILSQGGTAGRIKLNFDIEFAIAGQHYRKAPTDDVWNLSALGTTSGAEYKAVRLYLDSSGTGSVAAGTAAASAALAKAALPALDTAKACVGVYVMGLSGNFANALDAQGTYVDGWAVSAF